jgi:hypothetical protein
MIHKNVKALIEKYCMGRTPTDAQLDEIMDSVLATNTDVMEANEYIQSLINGPTKQELKAKRKAAEDAKPKFAFENIEVYSDGHKELFIDFNWVGPDGHKYKNGTNVPDIKLLNVKKQIFYKYAKVQKLSQKKCRFTLEDYMSLDLKLKEVNTVSFHLQLCDGDKVLATTNVIKVKIYYEFHIFGKNIMEVREVII